jgi:hypothetical protein
MNTLIALASSLRLNAVLCCGAALLLSACGAGVSDPVNGLPSPGAAAPSSDAAQPAAHGAPAIPYGADATPGLADAAAAAMPVATPAAPAAATRVAAASNIEPAYDRNLQPARTAGFSDQSETPVDAAQESAPAACDTAGCQH